jgi:hypothetical protein
MFAFLRRLDRDVPLMVSGAVDDVRSSPRDLIPPAV